MTSEEAIAEAWRLAANDLGITVEILGELTDPAGEAHPFLAHVHDFGSPQGTLAFAHSDRSRELFEIAKDQGFYCSFLFHRYETYERQFFIETLNDWRWCAVGKPPPAWYTGEPWTG